MRFRENYLRGSFSKPLCKLVIIYRDSHLLHVLYHGGHGVFKLNMGLNGKQSQPNNRDKYTQSIKINKIHIRRN